MKRHQRQRLISIAILILLIATALFVLKEKGVLCCGGSQSSQQDLPVVSGEPIAQGSPQPLSPQETKKPVSDPDNPPDIYTTEFDYALVPESDGELPYVEINNNEPFFSDADKGRVDAFEIYSDLDSLGRCGVAYANICVDLMPTEPRGEIGSIKPSGWKQAKYDKDMVEGGYLWNRCHLIGFQLAGENANKLNLITGTRYLNVTGMLVFEDQVASYVKDEPGNHVLYRVTPVFVDNELVARGVLIEAYSVEDGGELQFCIYCYNIQPGIGIDYQTGESWEDYE